MLNWCAADLAQVTGGELAADPNVRLSAIEFDSRKMRPGSVFVALTTGARDGHEFVEAAFAAGAALALVQRPIDHPHVLVPDTLEALQAVGSVHRDAMPTPVYALTGSMGKTTTRRLLQAILAQRGSVLATQGNFNNHIGVPLTLARFKDESQIVLEMGANHQGEIAVLRALGRPTIVAITMAGRAHLEGFGGISGVIQGKGEILDDLPAEGVAVLNAQDAAFETWVARVGDRRVVSFGEGGHVQAENIKDGYFDLVIGDQRVSIALQLPGRHQINNALCAAAMAHAGGASLAQIASGLESVQPESGRGRRITHRGITLIDDSYNANPDAMNVAVAALVAEDPAGIAILGEMRELGEASEAAHVEVGQKAREAGLKHLWTMNQPMAQGFGDHARRFDSVESIQAALDALEGAATVLVKGSRGAAMERCFAHWKIEE